MAVLVVSALLIIGSLVISSSLGGRATTSTVTTHSHPCLGPYHQGLIVNSDDFTVEVSFRGHWNATISTYSALDTNPTYIHTANCYAGSGDASIYVIPWNPSGEQTVAVIANKLDASHDNLTVGITWGAATRSNSTISPFGSVTASIGTVS